MPPKTWVIQKAASAAAATGTSFDVAGPSVKLWGRKRKQDPDEVSVTSKVGRVTRSKSGTVKKPTMKPLVSVNTIMETEPDEQMMIDDVLGDVEDPSDEDSISDEELEEILAGFDVEGKPIENLNDPIDLHLTFTRQKRFRKPYVPQALPETQLFTKNLKGGMTRSLGNLDSERRLCNLVRSSGTSLHLDKASPRVQPSAGVDTFVEKDSKTWLLSQLQRFNPGTLQSLSIDLGNDYLQSTFGSIWNQLLGKPQVNRIQDFMDSFSKTLQLVNLGYLGTLARNLSLQVTLVDWESQLDRKICEKNTVIDYWRLYRNWLMARGPEFDESSRGLKILRRSLDVPYFKCWLGHSSAPSIFPKNDIANIISKTLSAKKKWTIKDVAELRTCILKTIQEARLVRVHGLAAIMIQFFNGNQMDDETMADILDEINQPDGLKEFKWANAKRSKKKGESPEVTLSPAVQAAIAIASKELPATLRTCKDVGDVRKWLGEEKRRLVHLKYDQVFNDGFTSEDVDWNVVSTELMNLTKKFRAPEDCKMCFEHAANPMYETKRNWSEVEKNILKEKTATRAEWGDISKSLGGKPRPEFLVYYKWYKTCKPQKIVWTKSQETVVRNLIQTSSWDKVATEVGNPLVTKKHVQERFKKVLNPILRFGKFTRVEDSLMMLTLEKLKGHFEREKHFGIMTAYLPWRYESAWRDRAENLFAEYIVPWTIVEDTQLMELAIRMRRDWSRIAKTFTSFKTRKGCLTRHKILQKRLEHGTTLEEYHHSYAMIRYNVQEYRHLKDISTLLKDILLVNVPELTCQRALARDRPPREEELEDLILSFDRDIMSATVRVIDTYLAARDEFWTDWRKKNNVEPGQMRRTHDRRTFHADNTQSIASALHIRDVKLIPKGSLTFKPTQRETEVYKFYAQFCSTKPLKKDKPRPYIPLASKLVQLEDVKRICVKGSAVAPTPTADTVYREFALSLPNKTFKIPKLKKFT